MRFSILSIFILIVFSVATPTASAQFNIGAQVSEQMRSVIEAFTGNTDRAKEQAQDRLQNARETRERANDRSRSPQRAVSPEPSRGSRVHDTGATSTRNDPGSRVQRAFERATQETASSSRNAALERIREKQAEKRAEIREKIDEIHRERIHAFAERMFARLQAAIDRLNRLADRIDSRIQKFNEAGIDTADAETALAEARARISVAQSNLEDASVVFDDIRDGDLDPRDVFADIKTLIRETTGLIKGAHASLVDVIRILKNTLGDEINENQNESEENPEEDTDQATSTEE